MVTIKQVVIFAAVGAAEGNDQATISVRDDQPGAIFISTTLDNVKLKLDIGELQAALAALQA